MSKVIKLKLTEIPEPGARSISYAEEGQQWEGFVVRFAGEVRAYENHCPHTGANLNWSDDQFFELDHKFLQCSLHGALFQPLSGECVWGPCVGKNLKSLPVKLVDSQVFIYI